MTAELAVVVPTFNEQGNVSRLYGALETVLAGLEWEVVFVDDDSGDGTESELRELASQRPRARRVHRIGRRGLASACIEGALATTAPFICVMDADLQHDESRIPAMLALLKQENADIVVASRYMESGSTGGLAPGRARMSRIATRLTRAVAGVELTDPMSGFFVMRRTLFDEVVRRLYGRGFKILLDILLSSPRPVRYRELPYTMRARESGSSKLSVAVLWDFLTMLGYRLLGRVVPARFISFAGVGLTGVFVQLAFLGLFHRVLDHDFTLSQALATVVAMTSNFVLNNHFTYRDRRLHGWQFLRGLVSFYLACAVGAFINVAIADRLFSLALPWWLAGLCGAVAGAVWNYAVTAVITWRASHP